MIAMMEFTGEQEKKMAGGVSESEFYMWRAIFAMAHADHVVTSEERRFMNDVLKEIAFSAYQKAVLTDDIENARDIAEMFAKISEPPDRSQFFYYARMLVWCDGDFDEQEQKILTELKKYHIENIDFDAMLERVDLALENEDKDRMRRDVEASGNDKGGLLSRFLHRFGRR